MPEASFLLNDSFKNHTVKNLISQIVHRRKRNLLLTKRHSGLMHPLLKLDFRNDVVIDNRGDAVYRNNLLSGRFGFRAFSFRRGLCG